ncbi:MAG: Crp/Fnr family transcriptional regulator [Leptonema sp. (in: Bacteria)]|nr:Crp/Fnr family transcriptional regulator [Leptonema sp. (in: bacteria)]
MSLILPESLFEKFGKEFQPGQIIFCEWEPGNDFYFVQKGRVKIIKTFGNTQKTLDVMSEGDIFGEMAILEEEPRSASAIAIDNVKALHFNRANFDTLMSTQPQLAYSLLLIYTRRIYDARRRLQVLLIEDLNVKVADVFLMLAEKDPHYSSNQVILSVTVDDIANWCGQPVDEVNRVIMAYVRQGKIELYADRIVIPNLKDLQRIVNAKKKALS